jgi:hypothetical protein
MPKLTTFIVALTMPLAALTGLAGMTQPAQAVVYCTYIGYPMHCVARPGVRLVARPVGVGHVTAPRPGNRNGGVNRVGPRR